MNISPGFIDFVLLMFRRKNHQILTMQNIAIVKATIRVCLQLPVSFPLDLLMTKPRQKYDREFKQKAVEHFFAQVPNTPYFA